MGAYSVRSTGLIYTSSATPEVQTLDLGDISTADTFKLTYNTHESAAITYSTDMSTDITAALVGLADFDSGDVVAAKTSLTVYTVTFGGAFAGVNAGAITITSASGFTPVGVTETTSGRSYKTGTISLGSRFAQVYGVRWGLFVNGSSNELTLSDAAGRTFYSVTGKDTDVSSVKLTTFIGQDGRDQGYNAAANLTSTFVEGPITYTVKNGSGTVSPASGSVELLVKNGLGSRFVERSTGTITTNSSGAKTISNFGLGETCGRIIAARIQGFDSSTDYAITDTDGRNVFTKTALDATTALLFSLGYDGEDQAGNAAADTLPGVFRGPLTIAITNGGNATSGSIKFWCEV